MAVLCCVLFCECVCSQAATEADACVMCVGHTWRAKQPDGPAD